MKVAIFNDTRPTSHYGCMLVMKNLLEELDQLGIDVCWTYPVSNDWRKNKNAILNKPKVDAIIVNGEGTIHHAEERKFAMALASLAEFVQKKFNIPCYLINATLHKNSDRTYRLLSAYRAIYVRDQRSLHELNKAGLPGKYVPDLTFAGGSKDPSPGGNGTCVIDSAVKEDYVELKNYAEQFKLPFRSMIVARPGNAKFLRSPRPYVKNIYRWLKSERKISTNPDSYIEFLRNYDLVLTGRYHTVTMCIKNQVPFVALESNTPKVNSLLLDVYNSSGRSMTIEEFKQDSDKGKYLFSNTEIKSMTDFCQHAEVSIHLMLKKISEDIRFGKGSEYCYEE